MKRQFGQLSFAEENIEYLFDKAKGYSEVANRFTEMMMDEKVLTGGEAAKTFSKLVNFSAQEVSNVNQLISTLLLNEQGISFGSVLHSAAMLRADPNQAEFLDIFRQVR
ncbi:MAG: hypothetical protein IH897_14035, partial [Planctomycetes bacterium]|nr:hypothetical protein [Planctomycetota bacterium]